MSEIRHAILVLGMHRSGTSLLAGLIEKGGFSIGRSVMEPREDNPKGFFENQRIVDFNEKLLNRFDLDWASWDRLPENWSDEIDVDVLDGAETILDQEFVGLPPRILIKDPRICRLLPLWQLALSSKGYEITLVFTTRMLGDVVASLKSRDGMGQAQAEALWCRYNLDALQNGSGMKGLHVSYEDVMRDPHHTLKEIAKLCGLQIDYPDQEFVDSQLRHHITAKRFGWTEWFDKNCENFPAPPDEVLEEILFPLLARAAEIERDRYATVNIGTDATEGLEAALFAQSQEAKRHALSLETELETSRGYVEDLERSITALRDSSQEEKESLSRSLDTSVAHAKSLEAVLELKEQSLSEATVYSQSLKQAIDEKDAELTQLRQHHAAELQQASTYSDTLKAELDRKEQELREAHASLESKFRETEHLNEELMKVQASLDEELSRFVALRKLLDMLERGRGG